MKFLQRFLMGLGTILLLALALQLVAPKAVHAVVSTLVTVANTATNPVPVHSVDSPAPLQTFEVVQACAATNVGDLCSSSLLDVPLGMTAVVQDVSGLCESPTPNGAAPTPPGPIISVAATRGGFLLGALVLPASLQTNTQTVTAYVFGRQTTFYAASSATSQANIYYILGIQNPNTNCPIHIVGYYIPNNVTDPVN